MTNINDLPDDSPVGHSMLFHSAGGETKHVVCESAEDIAFPCMMCLYKVPTEDKGCPWDPDSGEYLCDVYKCYFRDIDKVMEDL